MREWSSPKRRRVEFLPPLFCYSVKISLTNNEGYKGAAVLAVAETEVENSSDGSD